MSLASLWNDVRMGRQVIGDNRERLYRYSVQSDIAYGILGIDPVSYKQKPYDPQALDRFIAQCSTDPALKPPLRARCTRWAQTNHVQKSALLRDLFGQLSDNKLEHVKKVIGGSL